MATAEVQRATHAIDERVGEVGQQVSSEDVRVVSIDEDVAEVINGVYFLNIMSTSLNPCSSLRPSYRHERA